MFFKKNNDGIYEYLIVGLGNPGKKYDNTRHNVGFMCLDMLADEYSVKINKLKFSALIADIRISGTRCLLMKPQTFMNLSGDAVSQAANFYKIPPERIIIIFDDISLDVGKLRIRRKGSHGGHNGLKSIAAKLSSNDYPRIKIGVGAKPHPDYDLADWVLSNFNKDESKLLKESLEASVKSLEFMVKDDIDTAMSRFNS